MNEKDLIRLANLRKEKKRRSELPHLYGQKFYNWGREFFDSQNKMVLLVAANQIGKALCTATPIPTPTGFKQLEKVKVGDFVFGRDGTPKKVLAVPFEGTEKIYHVTFSDNSSIYCGKNHDWTCREVGTKKWEVYSTEVLHEVLGARKIEIPMPLPVQYPKKTLKHNPFLLGYTLSHATGSGEYQTFVNKDNAVKEYIRRMGFEISESTLLQNWKVKGFHGQVDKTILMSSVDDRLSFLEGVFWGSDNTKFTTRHVKYVHIVGGVISSLGSTCTMEFNRKDKVFVLSNVRKSFSKRIVSIKETSDVSSTKCLTVEGGEFLCGYDYTVTHNSSIQIRKIIHWATAVDLWPKLWNTTPRQFWFLMPSLPLATAEFETKWVPDFMPRGDMKNDPVYGWEAVYKNRIIQHIQFNSGVRIYFHAYSKNVMNLQASTIHYCFTAGTRISVRGGDRNIEYVEVGDEVLTRKGYRKVKETMVHESPVLPVCMENGSMLEGTDTHPIMVIGKGWTDLKNLEQGDYVWTTKVWTQIGRLYYFRADYLLGILRTKIEELSGTLGVGAGKLSMLRYGKHTMKWMFLKATLFTIKTLIHLTTTCPTLCVSLGRNTIQYIKPESGKPELLKTMSVKHVEKSSKQGLPKTEQECTAPQSVKAHGMPKIVKLKELASNVAKLQTWREALYTALALVPTAAKSLLTHTGARCVALRLLRRAGVVTTVQEVVVPSSDHSRRRVVYNLTVDEVPEYFANNILVHNCASDEELPESHYEELAFRLAAVDGYFSMVFTATLGQELWYKAMERIGKRDELFKKALKIHATAYDCLTFEDGTKSPLWSTGKIRTLKAACSTENEVLKRIYGRFVKDEGLLIPAFSRSKNVVKPYPIPQDWLIYGAADIGGGGSSHPGAIVFLAVKPNFTKGAIYRGWRGDKHETTTSQDILMKYRALRGEKICVQQFYDWASKDFATYATRLNEYFTPAEKSHSVGRDTMNTLLNLQMLDIFDIPELEGLPTEISSLALKDVESATAKKHAKDDFFDAARYVVTGVPWNYTEAAEAYKVPEMVKKKDTRSPLEKELDLRRNGTGDTKEYSEDLIMEINEWNELYEGF